MPYLDIGVAVVVHKPRGAQKQAGRLAARGVHDAKVALGRVRQVLVLLGRQGGDITRAVPQLVAGHPFPSRAHFNLSPAGRVPRGPHDLKTSLGQEHGQVALEVPEAVR